MSTSNRGQEHVTTPRRSVDDCQARPWRDVAAISLPGSLWTMRLAGARSARPALELFEDGVLLDIVSSTPIAPQLVRGARMAMDRSRPRTLAWGRLPEAGACPVVEFTRGRRPGCRGAVMQVTDWCWIAVADGSFDRVTVRAGADRLRFRVSGGRPWH